MSAAVDRPPLPPETLVPIPCTCEHGQHGCHQVPARRLQKGGDLRGKVRLPAGALEIIDGGQVELKAL
jgi:hypothetical protein